MLANTRQQRGLQIAQTFRLRRNDKGWIVPSQTGKGNYVVTLEGHEPTCTCPDCEMRRTKCKHIWAVEYFIKKEMDNEGNTKTTEAVRVTYSQNWKAYDQAQTHEKEMFLKLMHELCENVEQPKYKFGRPTLPMSDMVFASALKVYTTFSLRRFESDMREAKEKGYVDKTPCFASVGQFIQREELTPILMELIKKSSLPLASVEKDFAVDSSGFGTSRFKRWYDFKYGKEMDKRVWIKAHISCGTKTNVITAVRITESKESDCTRLKPLIEETAENFEIRDVSADKAYLSVKNFKTVEDLGGVPYIPFKSNSTGSARKKKIWKKMYHFFMFNNEEFMAHYHKRSNVETTFHMIKTKFGDAVRSKSKTAQHNEVLLKILCHNIVVLIQEMHELGIEEKF